MMPARGHMMSVDDIDDMSRTHADDATPMLPAMSVSPAMSATRAMPCHLCRAMLRCRFRRLPPLRAAAADADAAVSPCHATQPLSSP